MLFTPTFLRPRGYQVSSADFDGATALSRGGKLTGVADGKQGIFSAWVRLDGSDGAEIDIIGVSVGQGRIFRGTTNTFAIEFKDTGGAIPLRLDTVNTYTAGTTWYHILASWDMATAGARWLYVNDVSDLSVAAFSNATLAYSTSVTSYWLGANNTFFKFDGCMAELYFNTTTSLDLSVAANRRKFISATGKPVFLGADGSLPTGSAPIMYHRVAKGAAASTFATNLGTGGNFSATSGALTLGSTSPTG